MNFEFNSKVIERYTEMNHFGRLIDLNLIGLEKGACTYQILVKEELLATTNVIHGGVLSAIMDTIMGVAALTEMEEQKKLVATLEFKITYFNPAFINDTLQGKGKVLQSGKRIIYSEGVITNQDGVVICKGTGTFNAYPAEKVGLII